MSSYEHFIKEAPLSIEQAHKVAEILGIDADYTASILIEPFKFTITGIQRYPHD